MFIRVPFQLHEEHTALQQLIVHIVISILPGTHLDLNEVKHVWVKSLTQGHKHRDSVPTLRGEKHFSENRHQAQIDPTRQAAAVAKRHALFMHVCILHRSFEINYVYI